MTDEELADLRERLAYSLDQEYAEDWRIRPDDVEALLAEVERLRADVAFWHDAHATVDAQRVKAEGRARRAAEIVQAVATTFTADGYGRCAYCGAEPATMHADDCATMKALALLASE